MPTESWVLGVHPIILRNLTRARRLTRQGIAETVGVAPATIDHLLDGRRDRLRADLARKLAAALDLPPEALWLNRTTDDAAIRLAFEADARAQISRMRPNPKSTAEAAAIIARARKKGAR